MNSDQNKDDLPESEKQEMAYVDRLIDSMWFILNNDQQRPNKATVAEWAKHLRNAYLRMARRLAQAKAQFGEDPLTCPCAKENKVHPDCQEAEHCVRKQA